MGSVLTPSYVGLENALDLPQASTLCGECEVVCPVRIPLPGLMRKLREEQMERGLRPFAERFGLKLWAALAMRPALYAFITRIAASLLAAFAGDKKRLAWMPFGSGWTATRDFPAPSGETFRERVKKRQPSRPVSPVRQPLL
jgi:L-lactate dehydrogenase complex protein LldF